MFNWFIEDKGFCRSYAVDKRISNNIDAQEKEELLCQFLFNSYIGKNFTEKELTEREMFLKLKESDISSVFGQLIAFEGIFLTVEVIADKTEEGYKIRKIQFGGSSEQANEVKQKPASSFNDNNGREEKAKENDSASKMRFVEATRRRSKLLEYRNVEKVDTAKYNAVMSGQLKGLFYYIDSNNSNAVKVIDTLNSQRKDEMIANTSLEATLWLLGYEQEYIKLATQEEDIVNIICDTARHTVDMYVIKSIRMMNQKMFNDALRENPAADGLI